MTAIGSSIVAWWEDEQYVTHHGHALVIASSRSKRTIPAPAGWDTQRWFKVTQADIANGDVSEEADAGCWAADGTGQGWIEVAIPKETVS